MIGKHWNYWKVRKFVRRLRKQFRNNNATLRKLELNFQDGYGVSVTLYFSDATVQTYVPMLGKE